MMGTQRPDAGLVLVNLIVMFSRVKLPDYVQAGFGIVLDQYLLIISSPLSACHAAGRDLYQV